MQRMEGVKKGSKFEQLKKTVYDRIGSKSPTRARKTVSSRNQIDFKASVFTKQDTNSLLQDSQEKAAPSHSVSHLNSVSRGLYSRSHNRNSSIDTGREKDYVVAKENQPFEAPSYKKSYALKGKHILRNLNA